jgi:hypothetical protein
MPIFTTGRPQTEDDLERNIYGWTASPPQSPLTPTTPTGPVLKPQASRDSLHDYIEGRRPYRRTQTNAQTLKRWLIGPPILLICLAIVFGLAWLVFKKIYKQ